MSSVAIEDESPLLAFDGADIGPRSEGAAADRGERRARHHFLPARVRTRPIIVRSCHNTAPTAYYRWPARGRTDGGGSLRAVGPSYLVFGASNKTKIAPQDQDIPFLDNIMTTITP